MISQKAIDGFFQIFHSYVGFGLKAYKLKSNVMKTNFGNFSPWGSLWDRTLTLPAGSLPSARARGWAPSAAACGAPSG